MWEFTGKTVVWISSQAICAQKHLVFSWSYVLIDIHSRNRSSCRNAFVLLEVRGVFCWVLISLLSDSFSIQKSVTNNVYSYLRVIVFGFFALFLIEVCLIRGTM